MDFTESERKFLEVHNIDVSDIFDARGLSKKSWKEKANKLGCPFILGSKCHKAGHRLRTRSGHCIQCDTSKIKYQRRHERTGFVYVAGSLELKAIKIGTADNIISRMNSLNKEKYGGSADWNVLFHVRTEHTGTIEQRALSELKDKDASFYYFKDQKQQKSVEIRKCSAIIAINAIMKQFSSLSYEDKCKIMVLYKKHKIYNFGEN